MRKFMRNNGLSIVLGGLFLLFLVGHAVTGFLAHNDEQREHGQPEVALGEYLTTGHFIESVAENWESEFLQMAMFVILTKKLYQKGSSESKDPDEPADESDAEPRDHMDDPDAPWPVRQGGFILTLYEHSLSIVFFLMFLVSIALHAVGGMIEHNQEQLEHGQPTLTLWQFIGSSQFWFQSFQNWQSEFLAIFCVVLFSVFLRERGSPQSKPVHYSYAAAEP